MVDLSFPEGHSINNMILKTEYLGVPIGLRYPGVDNLVEMVKVKGKGCALYKRELCRAFHQFPVDPGEINLLGWTWVGSMYFDLALVMACSSSCFLCQKVTDALKHIFQKLGFDLLNYIDDLVSAEDWQQALVSYSYLGGLVEDAGTEESIRKACSPDVKLIFLGVLFDTSDMTLSVTQ